MKIPRRDHPMGPVQYWACCLRRPGAILVSCMVGCLCQRGQDAGSDEARKSRDESACRVGREWGQPRERRGGLRTRSASAHQRSGLPSLPRPSSTGLRPPGRMTKQISGGRVFRHWWRQAGGTRVHERATSRKDRAIAESLKKLNRGSSPHAPISCCSSVR